jgi:hypothetical protein
MSNPQQGGTHETPKPATPATPQHPQQQTQKPGDAKPNEQQK